MIKSLKKGLINIQNGDGNKCVKWYLVRYLQLVKLTKILQKSLILKTLNSLRYSQNRKKTCISNIIFGHENREKFPISVSIKHIF